MNQIQSKIQHLSPSSIRTYLDNPHVFKARYIDGRSITQSISPSLIEGSWIHKAIEHYWNLRLQGCRHEDTHFHIAQFLSNNGREIMEALSAPILDFGKTGSIQKSMEIINNVAMMYAQEAYALFDLQDLHPEAVEVAYLEDIAHPVTGEVLPFKLKGVADLEVSSSIGAIIVDHKIVSSFSDPTDPPAKYIAPAMLYYFLYVAKHGKPPAYIFYDEIKKSKNRDGGSQVNRIRIPFTKQNLSAMFYIFETICYELLGEPILDENGIKRFLPNPFVMMGAEDVFSDFTQHIKYIY